MLSGWWGSYQLDRKDIPINQQVDFAGKGGITLAQNIWLGAHAVVLDGVTVGHGSVIVSTKWQIILRKGVAMIFYLKGHRDGLPYRQLCS